jgi:hypothetical protein
VGVKAAVAVVAGAMSEVGIEFLARDEQVGGEILIGTLERNGAHALRNCRTRIAQRFLALAACVALTQARSPQPLP